MKKRVVITLILLTFLFPAMSAARGNISPGQAGTHRPPANVDGLRLTPLPLIEVDPFGITPMDNTYIDRVLNGLNNTRAKFGNVPLELRDDLNYAAQHQAYAMAKRNAMFHSGAPCFEACYVDLYQNTQYAETVGALLAIHCGQMAADADMKAFGIGAYTWEDENGNSFAAICVTASKADDLSKYNHEEYDWKDNENWK